MYVYCVNRWKYWWGWYNYVTTSSYIIIVKHGNHKSIDQCLCIIIYSYSGPIILLITLPVFYVKDAKMLNKNCSISLGHKSRTYFTKVSKYFRWWIVDKRNKNEILIVNIWVMISSQVCVCMCVIIGSGWSVPVELIVGSEAGISYSTEKSHSPTLLAEFNQVSITNNE